MDRHTWTGMHEPAYMLLLLLLRACVATYVIDTMYPLIYSSAQTRRGESNFRIRILADIRRD
jgi:hypothetical protein